MINTYGLINGKLVSLGSDPDRFAEAVWIDLLRPDAAEETTVERLAGLDVPTREEMQEIELSSRLYQEAGATFMTASVLSHTDADDVTVSPMTFILAKDKLITVRYEDPRTFGAFVARGQRAGITCPGAAGIAVSLLESNVERLADVLERAAHDLESLSKEIFRYNNPGAAGKAPGPRGTDFQKVLVQIGRKGDLVSNVRDSLISMRRLSAFFLTIFPDRKSDRQVIDRLKTLARDLESLSDHASFESQKVNFLLDATLGMINIEQNGIIKIFSVAAVVFLPPTLVASIYGMNFDVIPELHWAIGYPLALGLMVMSAVLPYFYFKGRGWL